MCWKNTNIWISYNWTGDWWTNTRVILTVINTTSSSWLVSSVRGALQRSRVQLLYKPNFFSGSIFTMQCSLLQRSLSLSFINDFHIFTAIHSSPQRFITNQQNDQLPVGLLAQLVEHCTGIAEVLGLTPQQVWFFFRPYFITA